MDTVAKSESTIVALATPHSMSLNAVSKHIKVLERAGLVYRKVDGNFHRISMNHAAMTKAAAWMSKYVPFWGDALRNLKSYVESP